MGWSIPIFRVAGIQLRIHVTFLLLIAWLAFGSVSTAILVLLLFVCVVLHEFGHALAAKGYGINTPDITLLPIGGVARLERMPREPWQEFVVAICGPLVNVAIAIIASVFMRFAPSLDFDLDPTHTSFASMMFNWNVIMVAFNMIPAFPMD